MVNRGGVASGGGELIVSDGVVGEEDVSFVVGGGFEDGCCVEGEGGCCVRGREEGFVQVMSGFVWGGGVEGDGGFEE